MPERNRVRPDPKLRAPLLRDRLRHPRHAGFRHAVVDLARVAVRAARARDLHDAARRAVLDAEVGRGGAHEAEGRRRVHVDDRGPLLVSHLVDYPVPGVAGVVDDDVDLAVAVLRCGFDQLVHVGGVGHVARDGDGGTRVCIIDFLGGLVGLCGIDVADDDFGAFVGEEAGCFGAWGGEVLVGKVEGLG